MGCGENDLTISYAYCPLLDYIDPVRRFLSIIHLLLLLGAIGMSAVSVQAEPQACDCCVGVLDGDAEGGCCGCTLESGDEVDFLLVVSPNVRASDWSDAVPFTEMVWCSTQALIAFARPQQCTSVLFDTGPPVYLSQDKWLL